MLCRFGLNWVAYTLATINDIIKTHTSTFIRIWIKSVFTSISDVTGYKDRYGRNCLVNIPSIDVGVVVTMYEFSIIIYNIIIIAPIIAVHR